MLFFNVCAKFGRNCHFQLQNKSTETKQRPERGCSYPCWPLCQLPGGLGAGGSAFPPPGVHLPPGGPLPWPPHHGQLETPERVNCLKGLLPELSMGVAPVSGSEISLNQESPLRMEMGPPVPLGAPTSVPQAERSRKDHPHVSSSQVGLGTVKPTSRTHLGSRGVGAGLS